MVQDPHPTKTPHTQLSALSLSAVVMSGFVAILWVIQIIDATAGYPLMRYGIEPRTPARIEDIFTSPFIHASYSHLLGNTFPLLILGFLVALSGIRRFVGITVIVIIVSGLGVWLTAPSRTDTVGVSGVIFGYFGYLVARGVFERRLIDIVIAIAVGVSYWSILPALVPGVRGISWQDHLFGLLGGILTAWLFRSRRTTRRRVGSPTSSDT